MVEFLLAMMGNLKIFFVLVATLSLVGFLLTFPLADLTGCNATEKAAIRWRFRLVWIGLATGLLGCLPSVNQLWEVRIAMVKFELASPENVGKTVDEIGRIGKKLECKYLGCQEEKSK